MDLELWHALHDECPIYGCGSCVTIDLEWSEQERREIEMAAALLGEPVDVFIHKAVVAGMKSEGY